MSVIRAHALVLTPNIVTGVTARVGALPNPDSTTSYSASQQSGVKFSGYAYPHATVIIQKGLVKLLTVTADANGAFSVFVPENNSQLFVLYAIDAQQRRSTLLNFPTTLYSGYLTDISGIRFAPTIETDKVSVKYGEYLTIYGSGVPNTSLEIYLDGKENYAYTLLTDKNGTYSITIPILLADGEYLIKVGYTGDKRVSRAIRVVVGTSTIFQQEATDNIPGDCNIDQRITIVDFSVLAYWFEKKNPPRCVDVNHDGVINLTDFSIVAFYWSE